MPGSNHLRKVAVFRALQLGDLLCAVPALRALSRWLQSNHPGATVTLIGLPWAESLTKRYPRYVQSFIHFPGYAGLPEQPYVKDEYNAFVQRVRAEGFDLILQMQGNGTIVNELVQDWGAVEVSGFSPITAMVRTGPGDSRFMPYPEDLHEIHRHLSLMEHLGIPIAYKTDSALEFDITAGDTDELMALRLGLTPGKYVCIHPGSRGQWRQWPPRYFARLTRYFMDLGYQVVLTGTANEMDIIEEVVEELEMLMVITEADHLKPPVESQGNEPALIIAAGKTSLGAMAALIADARMLISNCTGVAHIGAALRVASVVISMDGEPWRWGPLDHRIHRTIDWTKTKDFNVVMDEVMALLLKRSVEMVAAGPIRGSGL